MLPQLYHAQHRAYKEDLPFWLDLAAQAGGPVLELGCGTGRVLIPLAKAGYRLTGIDRNPAMLRFLLANIDEDISPKPQLVVADMCQFNLEAKFSLVILPCNTFSTLSENERIACLCCVHKALIPGGRFAVSTVNPGVLHSLPPCSRSEIEDEFLHPQTGNPVQVSSSWRRNKRAFIVTWTYDHLLPDGLVEHLVVENVHYIVPLDTQIDEIQRQGFSVDEYFGDFKRSGYAEDSPHLIILAAKM